MISFTAVSTLVRQMIVNRLSEDIIARKVFKNLEWDEFEYIGRMTHPNDMIELHDSLGRQIRNDYQLWSRYHTPRIVDGVDVSKDHPDAISSRIMKQVWELVHEF